MAFFSNNGVLCRDLWPKNAATLPKGFESVETLSQWRILPTTYEELCERVNVEGSAYTVAKIFAKHPQLEGRMQLAVRIQGIVGDVQLGAKGDWTGEIDHAVKAMQSLTIVNEGCQVAFTQQRDGLANLEELILTKLNQSRAHPKGRVIQRGAICLRRRAFTKVGEGVKKVALAKNEDGYARIEKISNMWVVDHVVKASLLQPNGTVLKVHPAAIRRGDLVDVAATVEVVSMRGRGGRRCEVMLSPNHVLRLKSAIQMKAELALAEAEAAEPELPVKLGLDALDNSDVPMQA